MINYSALDYLKIDIANQKGLDKQSFKQRIAWVNQTKHFHKYVESADKPYQYMAAVQAYEDALAGVPTGHLVGLDACSSGIAIMGICMGCHVTSMNTGMIGDKRMDMYSQCTKTMGNILGSNYDVPRADVKTAQMTHFYGSIKEPILVFGEDTPELQAFYEAQETVAPGAVWLMDQLLMSWQPFALKHEWEMVDGFEVKTPVLSKEKSKIEIDELDHAQIQYVYEVNKGEKKGLAVAANVVHSIDAFLVRELNRRCNYNWDELLLSTILLEDHIKDPKPVTRTSIPKTERLWIDQGYLSLATCNNLLTASSVKKLSREYCIQLLGLIEQVMEYRSFELVTIHKSLWM